MNITHWWAKRARAVCGRSSIGWSLGIAAVLVTVKLFCEHQPWVESLERGAYERMQKQLVATGTRDRPQVLVIDIGNIKPERREVGGRLVTVTSVYETNGSTMPKPMMTASPYEEAGRPGAHETPSP